VFGRVRFERTCSATRARLRIKMSDAAVSRTPLWTARRSWAIICTMIRTVVLGVIGCLVVAQQVQAASACRPTRDGKDRIEKAGACPSGYFARGSCCESFQSMTQQALPNAGVKDCPAGTISRLGVCISAK